MLGHTGARVPAPIGPLDPSILQGLQTDGLLRLTWGGRGAAYILVDLLIARPGDTDYTERIGCRLQDDQHAELAVPPGEVYAARLTLTRRVSSVFDLNEVGSTLIEVEATNGVGLNPS